MIHIKNISLRLLAFVLPLLLLAGVVRADDKDFPERPYPKKYVNDLAGMMTPSQQQDLEARLTQYNNTSTCEVAIVTVHSIGDYDVSDYAIKLGKKWGVGKADKDNGIVILASLDDRKMFIAVGKGLEGALTDFTAGKIRDKMTPYFKQKQYYDGFSEGVNDVIAATKGEFHADEKQQEQDRDVRGRHRGLPLRAIVVIIIFIYIILRITRGGGGGGGNYISRSGIGNLATGFFLGNMLSGGRRGGDWGGGGGGWGGGSSGGFGGGDFGGGGAGGSW